MIEREPASSPDDLAFAPALVQAQLLRRRELKPIELVELYLERIERLNPMLGAYLTVASDVAAEMAHRAEEQLLAADDPPPFCGVPISIKDLDDTAGIRTTCGTASWSERVPDRDAHVVTRLKQAGFVVLGKTNTPEFGKSVVTEPDGFPPCRNPWDPARTSGGSSGGAASAVAAGLCPVSHGSDGGGSIRMPAACCGVFGVKPSRGRISSAPGFPSLFSVHGALSRTVSDAAASVDVMQGYEPGDILSAPVPERPFEEESRRDPGRLRIAVSTVPAVPWVTVDESIERVTRQAAELLSSLGHDVVDATPEYGELEMNASLVLRCVGLIERDDLPPVDSLGDVVRFLLKVGEGLTARDYAKALSGIQLQARRVVPFFDEFDVLLTPSIATRPPLVGEFTDVMTQPEGIMRFAAMGAFTGLWNNTGQPAVSIPFDIGSDGLPHCVQIVGRPADEATLFRLSGQIESVRPWAERRPRIS
jgi:amidase